MNKSLVNDCLSLLGMPQPLKKRSFYLFNFQTSNTNINLVTESLATTLLTLPHPTSLISYLESPQPDWFLTQPSYKNVLLNWTKLIKSLSYYRLTFMLNNAKLIMVQLRRLTATFCHDIVTHSLVILFQSWLIHYPNNKALVRSCYYCSKQPPMTNLLYHVHWADQI